MAKKTTTTKEIPTTEDVLPVLDANDINILYTLVVVWFMEIGQKLLCLKKTIQVLLICMAH